MYSKQKKAILKRCQVCEKLVPQYWKTLSIDGVRKKVCQRCAEKYTKAKEKQKKEKIQLQKRIKRERITEKKLDTVFSKLVRTIYPPYCHSSKVPITVETSQAAHLIGRNSRCVRWDLRNVYPTTPVENMHNQLHVIKLAKRLEEYYGINIDDWEAASKSTTCKLNDSDRRYMYDVFKDALDQTYAILLQDEPYEKLKVLREQVINKTKLIL